MKGLIHIVIVLAGLVAIAASEGCTPRYDGRLMAADSLMRDNPDSALAIVQDVDRAALATEGDRAYRDLLLTQARYRCYITATSDSDINRALHYYRHHQGEREKLTRALIYKGAVMEELGHPDSAMHYYTIAESIANPNDYYNLAYTNFRIGSLYQYYNSDDNVVLDKMRSAYSYSCYSKDTNLIILSLGTMATYLNLINRDSAKLCLNEAIKLAGTEHSDDKYYYQSKLAGMYFYENDYERAKAISLDIIRNGAEDCGETTYYYYAARSFVRLGKMDSAYWVKSIIPKPDTPVDSFNHYLLMAELSKARDKATDYALYTAQAERIHRTLVSSPQKSKILITELNSKASLRNKTLRNNYSLLLWTLAAIVLALTSAVIMTVYFSKEKRKRYQRELDQAEKELREMMAESEKKITELVLQRDQNTETIRALSDEMAAISISYSALKKGKDNIHELVSEIFRERISAINELYHDIRFNSISNFQSGNKRFISLQSLIKELVEGKETLHFRPKESFWLKLKSSVDKEFNGIATFVEETYPCLSINDQHLFWLLCAKIPSHIIKLCMNYTTVITVSNNKRRLIKDKIGLNVKFEEFIEMYLNGKLTP